MKNEKYKIVFYENGKVIKQIKDFTSFDQVMKVYWSEYFANYHENSFPFVTTDKDIKVFSNGSIV